MTHTTLAELLSQARAALAGVTRYLSGPRPRTGDSARALAACAGAPTLYRYHSDIPQLLQTLDIAASAVVADPCCGAGYALAAECLFRLGFEDRDCFNEAALAEARPWARRATELSPDQEAGWEALARIECFAFKFPDAEKVLGEIFRRFGDAALYARAAFLFFRLQADIDQAINWGALAWQQEEDATRLIDTLFGMGAVYEDSGRMKHAYDTYRMICEKDPKNAWGQFLWSRVTFALGGVAEARAMIERAVGLCPRPEFKELQAAIARGGTSRRLPAVAPPKKAPPPVAAAQSPAPPEVPPPPPITGPRLPRKRKKYFG